MEKDKRLETYDALSDKEKDLVISVMHHLVSGLHPVDCGTVMSSLVCPMCPDKDECENHKRFKLLSSWRNLPPEEQEKKIDKLTEEAIEAQKRKLEVRLGQFMGKGGSELPS